MNKNFKGNFYKIYYTNNYSLDKSGNYKLIQIKSILGFNLYFFNYSEYTIVLLIENNPNLAYYIGETFSLNIYKLTLIQEIKENENGNFRFLSIKDNKYIFNDLENNRVIIGLLQIVKLLQIQMLEKNLI